MNSYGALWINYLNPKGSGESDKVGADTETSTRPSGYCQARNIDIQNGKGGSSNQRDQCNLVKVKRAFRYRVCNYSYAKTLDDILNKTLKKLTKIKCSVHYKYNIEKNI